MLKKILAVALLLLPSASFAQTRWLTIDDYHFCTSPDGSTSKLFNFENLTEAGGSRVYTFFARSSDGKLGMFLSALGIPDEKGLPISGSYAMNVSVRGGILKLLGTPKISPEPTSLDDVWTDTFEHALRLVEVLKQNYDGAKLVAGQDGKSINLIRNAGGARYCEDPAGRITERHDVMESGILLDDIK